MSDQFQDDSMLSTDVLNNFSEKLKSTRENLGISVQEAASRLHLSPRFISMLENDNLLECTLPPIYLRGYLRSYTRLLNIPEAELACILERLNPKPSMVMDPVPVSCAVTSEPLSVSFPLENNPYYARIATAIITLLLLTSITAWWYRHPANDTASRPVAALEQPFLTPQEPLAQTNESLANPAPLTANDNTPLLQAEANAPAPQIEQAKVPDAAIDLATKKPVTLASAAPEQSSPTTVTKPTAKQDENDEDSTPSSDEQE